MATYLDFVGFSFNGTHSSDLGLLRISNGNRYEEPIGPDTKANTTTPDGYDGSLLFGIQYTDKKFTINTAFDSVTEEQLGKIRRWLNGKTVGQLIFDETPYKAYMVRITSAPKFNSLCFDVVTTGTNQTYRVYKGEMSVGFTTIKPYAESVAEGITQLNNIAQCAANINEWSTSFVVTYPSTTPFIDTASTSFSVTNPGDLPCYPKFYFQSISTDSTILDENFGILLLNATSRKSGDSYICVDMEAHCIYGTDGNFNPTGTLYGNAVSSGDFWAIPAQSTASIACGDSAKVRGHFRFF